MIWQDGCITVVVIVDVDDEVVVRVVVDVDDNDVAVEVAIVTAANSVVVEFPVVITAAVVVPTLRASNVEVKIPAVVVVTSRHLRPMAPTPEAIVPGNELQST